MVLVCPCAALTEGLSLCIVCICVNCLNIYYINSIVFSFLYYISLVAKKKNKNNTLIITRGIFDYNKLPGLARV